MTCYMMKILVVLGVYLTLIESSNSYIECESGCTVHDAKAPKDYNFAECEIESGKNMPDCGSTRYFNSTLSCCCRCPNGTFMGKRNICEYCRQHTKCAKNEEKSVRGSSNTDTKCRCRSFPIPWEECKEINCTVLPPDMTRTTQASNSGEPDVNTAQPSNSDKPDMNSPQTCKSEQRDKSWPASAIALCVMFGLFILIELIIIIIMCCCNKGSCKNSSTSGHSPVPTESDESHGAMSELAATAMATAGSLFHQALKYSTSLATSLAIVIAAAVPANSDLALHSYPL